MIASGSVRQLLNCDARGAGSARFVNARGRRILKLVASELQLGEGVHVGGLELEGELKHLDGFGGLVAGGGKLPPGHPGFVGGGGGGRGGGGFGGVFGVGGGGG